MNRWNAAKKLIYESQAKKILTIVQDYIKEIENEGFEHCQFFISFEDKLNELSIKDHNADAE